MKSITAFFKELWTRLSGSTPAFFKVIRNIAAFIAALGLIVQAIPTESLPESIAKYLNWVTIAAAVATAIMAQLPTTEKQEQLEAGDLPFTAKAIQKGKEPSS